MSELLPNAGTGAPRFLPVSTPQRPQATPSIGCPPADYRGWKTWRDAGAAMRELPVIPFGQAWLDKDEVDFRPAAVALAHHAGELIVYAELSDVDIFNPVRTHGEHAYAKGDVLEIFLRANGAPNYFEHHLTPEKITLQLSFPTPTAFAENCTGDPNWSLPFATTIPVRSQVLIQPALELWRVLAIVPLAKLTRDGSVPDDWRFSFCRYDHTQGREKPVLSSTTPYRVPNFHHQDHWGRLRLEK